MKKGVEVTYFFEGSCTVRTPSVSPCLHPLHYYVQDMGITS